MIFSDWMRHIGLSESSVLKYDGAINGALSEWAMDGGILDGPLSSISSKTQFDAIVMKIVSLPIYKERNARGHHMYSSALAKYSEYLAQGHENDVETDIESILSDTTLDETEKSSLVKSRIGQGTFRQKLIKYWGKCCATSFKDTNLLIASHIKPWNVSDNTERLDIFNGLLLTPNLDKAFDSGLITFAENGCIAISPQLTEPEKLGISSDIQVSLTPQHEKYMIFHRGKVFRA